MKIVPLIRKGFLGECVDGEKHGELAKPG